VIYLRSSLFAIGYTIFTTLYGAVSLPLYLLPPLSRHRIIISWTHVVIWWAKVTCGLRYQVIGKDNLSDLKNEPIVILSKHQCAWETFFLQGLFWPASTILKKELLKIPFFGWGLAALRPIAIDRSNPREALRQVKQQGVERLKDGVNLILFPEGTRVPIGERVKYARSGADIAKESGATIVPVCHNAGQYWGVDGNKFLKRPGLITVVIGEPIPSAGINTKEVISDVETWIESTLDDIVAGKIVTGKVVAEKTDS